MALTSRTGVIFGGSGFLGTHVVHALAKEGARLRIASRHPSQAMQAFLSGEVGQINVMPCDIKNHDHVMKAMEGVDFVVNLVGLLVSNSHNSFKDAHVLGAQNIAKACATKGIEDFVHVSALVNSWEKTQAQYAQTKRQAEEEVKTFCPRATLLRPSLLFGPKDGFFHLYAKLLCVSSFVPVIGGGHTKFQPLYVGDVAKAIKTALLVPDSKGRIYELGGAKTYSFKDLIYMIAKIIERPCRPVSLPYTLAEGLGWAMSFLPKPLLTQDQVRMLKHDSCVTDGALTLNDLGISPKNLETLLPDLLSSYKPSY